MADSFKLKHFEVQHHRSAMKVGTDALVLGAWLKPDENTKSILDVGTGCGIIALMLAQKSESVIDAIDIDKPTIDEASLNFRNSPWSNRLKAIYSSIQSFNPEPVKKYDLIVSNPPFFQKSLLPKSDKLKLAKHTANFPMDVFIRKSFDLLNVDGKLAVILPAEESLVFLLQAKNTGFFESKTLNTYPKTGRSLNRKVLVVSKVGVENPVIECLVIRDTVGNYTDQYKILTRDFHAEGYI